MKVKVDQVYAFVANGDGGNRAGVVLDAKKLTDKHMQYIARVIGASETAFVLPDNKATHRIRFFTPTVEVPLCGHATVATWSLMYKQGLHKAGSYTQNTQAGLLHITIGDDGLVFMEQPVQIFDEAIDIVSVSKALNLPESILDKRFKPQVVRHNLLVGVVSKDVLNNLSLNFKKLIQFGDKHNFDSLHVFTILKDEDALAAVRDFAPAVGIDEDAATGTTNGSFLTYLKRNNVLPKQTIYKIEQGEAIGQLSYIYGKFQGDRVWIGGRAEPSIFEDIEVS
jgi:PhzF family phenazine biosynthesis protein